MSGTCKAGNRSNTPVNTSCPIVLGTVANTPARPPTALAFAFVRRSSEPYSVRVAARARWRAARPMRLMWMHTGIRSSSATAQKASSSSLIESPADGQHEITTPLKPRAFALRSVSIMSSTPVDGSCAMPTRRVRSGAQNSSQRKSLYASTPARTKSSSSSPRK